MGDLQWRDSLYEGFGVETFPTGSHYVGEFHKGQAHGHGTCYYADGSTYAGQWDAGVQHGLGSQVTARDRCNEVQCPVAVASE